MAVVRKSELHQAEVGMTKSSTAEALEFQLIKGESQTIRELVQWLDPAHSIPKSKLAVVAECQGEVLGVCASWDNPTHPHREYVSAVVAPKHRRQGIAAQMFACLYEGRSCPLQTAFASSNEAARAFAEKLGFAKVRETYTYHLRERRDENPKNGDMRCEYSRAIGGSHELEAGNEAEKQVGKRTEEHGFSLVPIASLHSSERKAFYHLAYEDYARKHRHVNPLNPTYAFEDFAAILEDGMVEDASYVAREADALYYLFSYEDEEEEDEDGAGDQEASQISDANSKDDLKNATRSANAILIGYTGFSVSEASKNEHAVQAYRLFLETVLHMLVTRFDRIALEADDCDEDAMLLSSLFDSREDVTWDAYVRGNHA